MSKASSSTTSQTDWPRLKAMPDADSRLTAEHPAAEVDHIVRGIACQGLRPVPPQTLISRRMDVEPGPCHEGRHHRRGVTSPRRTDLSDR